jgi:hypothetical protein
MDKVFTLRIKHPDGQITIDAFEHFGHDWHTRLNVRVRQNGQTIFSTGDLWCGIPGQHTLDGKEAKACVLSLVSMKPGDTDREYFEHYTPEQLAWAEKYSDWLTTESLYRYGEN